MFMISKLGMYVFFCHIMMVYQSQALFYGNSDILGFILIKWVLQGGVGIGSEMSSNCV